ncbi:CDP-diacylglycerol--serine O-phosphatidyltransferase [Serratia symbiotica]|nr:CDP-diacylglycerol--serine O-phosphatidyltransferase [Serratia symbiotica]
MLLSEFECSKHQTHLEKLPKLPQKLDNIHTLYTPLDFRITLLKSISNATQYIYFVALYLHNDDAGNQILNALYKAKQLRPKLEIYIFVDWYRAQRGYIGSNTNNTNANWYYSMTKKYPNISIPIYGVPINTKEILGVLHLKGLIFDDTVIYTGANINNVYLHKHKKYRYDRYQLIKNPILAKIMINYIKHNILTSNAVKRLDYKNQKKIKIKNEIRKFRFNLKNMNYYLNTKTNNTKLSITPLIGLGKNNILNTTIYHLILCVNKKLIFCTPYFNLPPLLLKNIIYLLQQGKQVEIIVGDKTTNDFFIPEEKPFKIINILPYLYEINLRLFLNKLQKYIDTGQLIVRIWKDGNNSYHLKGIWVDNKWQLITGHNLNLRSWRFDLENAILIHDPENIMYEQKYKELTCIRTHTTIIKKYLELQEIQQYPKKIRKFICYLRYIYIDKLINYIL